MKHIVTKYKRTEVSMIAATMLLIVGLIVTVSILNNDTNTQTKAASVNSIEPENGAIAGNVTIVNDTAASGGKYVKFGTIPVNPYVTVCGLSLCLNGQEWYLYAASNLVALDAPDTEADLAVSGNINTIRIVDFLDTSGNPATAPFDEARWQKVDRTIAAAKARNLKVILDLSGYRNLLARNNINPYTQDWNPFITFAANRKNTVTNVLYKDDPTIALIDFAGEVEPPNASTNTLGVTSQQVTDFFRSVFAQWKGLDTNHLLSSGGFLQLDWNSGIDWKTIWNLPGSDVCNIHNYSSGDTNTTTPQVAQYCASINKPWITEEFGWEQGIGDSQRAANFQTIYNLQKQYNSAGVGFWNLWTDVRSDSFDVNPNTPLTWEVVRTNAF